MTFFMDVVLSIAILLGGREEGVGGCGGVNIASNFEKSEITDQSHSVFLKWFHKTDLKIVYLHKQITS